MRLTSAAIPVTVSTSFHNVRRIEASTTGTDGAPLTLTLTGDGFIGSSLTIFTDNQTMTDRLVEAINRIASPLMPLEPGQEPAHPNDYRD